LNLPSVQPRSDPRTAARTAPVAVVDIGSNSVRLVISEGARRAAAVVHNEKAICGIGRNMVSSGKLDEDGVELALEALARFRQLLTGHGVSDCDAVATAAARDADNGREFIARAEKALGHPIKVLAGEDEARIAAEGVLAGIPEADGLAADLGGGSLDMVPVKDGRCGTPATLPFGPLRLMDTCGGNLNKARDSVEKKLAHLPFADSLKGRALYAVGGVWRTLARVDMEQQHYPLHMLHHYAIPSGRAEKLCRLIAGQSRKSLEKMRAVSRRRAEALPYGALVLELMLETFGLKQVVVSAYGLREGLLQKKLPAGEARKDPLIEYAEDSNARESREPAHSHEVFRWMTPLFAKEDASERRVRLAACLMSDIGWRRHPDDRAMGTFAQVLHAPYGGADHHERATIATAIFYRYTGDEDFPEETGVAALLGAEGAVLALRIGLAARLAYALTAAMDGELAAMPLRVTERTVAIEVPHRRRALVSESVHKRLDELAEAFGKRGDVAIL
jgi:exopolyphosphatase / guanosine-5'-triphosphate,3'-diphosphate pyrophosphatase